MNEELELLLRDAHAQGFSTEQLDQIVQVYMSSKKPSAGQTPNIKNWDVGTNQKPTTRVIERYQGVEPDSNFVEELGQDFEDYVKAPYKAVASGIVNRIPEAYSTLDLETASGRTFADVLKPKYYHEAINEVLKDKPQPSRGIKLPTTKEEQELIDKYMLERHKAAVGEVVFNAEQDAFNKKRTAKITKLSDEVKQQQREHAEMTKGNVENFREITNPLRALNFISSGVGDAAATSAVSLGTGFTGTMALEYADAYNQGVEEISKKLTEEYGREITPKQVRELGLDRPAAEQAETTAAINTALESVGLLTGPLGKLGARTIAKSVSKVPLWKTLIKGGTGEGLTEFTQEANTIFESYLAAGLTAEEALGKMSSEGRWEEAVNAGLKGISGGIGLTTLSSTGQTKTEKAQEKAVQEQAQLDAKLEKADNIVNKDIAETEVKLEVDDLTEEDIVVTEDEIIQQAKLVKELEAQEKVAKAEEQDKKKALQTAEKAVKEIPKPEDKTKEGKTRTKDEAIQTEELKPERKKKPSTKTSKKVAVQKAKAVRKVSKTAEPKPVESKAVSNPITYEEALNTQTRLQEKKTSPSGLTKTETNILSKVSTFIKQQDVKNAEETNLGTEISPTGEETIKIPEAKVEPTTVEENVVSSGDVGVTTELTSKQQTKVKQEEVKFLNMFNNRNKLPKKSMRLKRLQELVDRIESSSISPESHKKLVDRIEKITTPLQEEAEALAEKKAEKVERGVKAPTKAEVQKAQDDSVKEERVRSLEKRKNEITKKYEKVTDKRGNLVLPAVPQVDDKGKVLWDQKDIDEIRQINDEIKSVATFTTEELEAYESARAAGGDHSVAKALVKGDSKGVKKGTPIDSEITNPKTRKELSGSISSIKQVSGQEYVDRLIANTPESLRGITGVMANKILEVIEAVQAKRGRSVKFYEMVGKQDGKAIRDNENYFILVNTAPGTYNRAGLHELIHALDFIGDQKRGLRNELDALMKRFSNIVSFKMRQYHDIAFGTSKRGLSTEDMAFFEYLYHSIPYSDEIGFEKVLTQLIDSPEKLIYGLTNSYEFVAEALSNPFLAAALATTQLSSESSAPTTTIFAQITNALVDIINKIIDFVSSSNFILSGNLEKLKGFSSSYLGHLISNLDKNLEASLREDNANDYLSWDAMDMGAEMPSQNKELSKEKKKLSDKLFRGAMKAGVTTQAELTSYLKGVLKDTELPKSIVNGLKTRLKNHLKHVKIVKSKDQLVQKQKSGFRYKKSPTYAHIIDDLGNLKPDYQKPVQIKNLSNLVQSIELGVNTKEMQVEVNKLSEYTAQANVSELTNPESGIKFKEFDGGARTLFSSFVNFNAFIKYISDYREKAGVLLHKYFYRPIETSSAIASRVANQYIEELNALSRKENLNEENFTNIYMYGILTRENSLNPEETLEDKINFQYGVLQNKRKAISTGQEKRYTSFLGKGLQHVERAERSLANVAQSIKDGKNPLTKGEQKYYDLVREILEELREPLKDNTELVHGEKFVWDNNYVPSRVIGKVSTDTSTSSGQNVTESDLMAHLNASTNPLLSDGTPRYSNVSTPQSGASKQRRARNANTGYYYDDNINTVMSKYINSTLFDIESGYNVKKLNHMFSDRGGMRSKLESENGLGHANTARVLGYIRRAITNSIMVRPNYGVGTKVALEVKNLIQTAKVSDITAPLTQYLTMFPATIALVGPKATAKALSTQIALVSNSAFGDGKQAAEFEEMLRQYSGELSVRNLFFEKYENLDDVKFKSAAGRFEAFRSNAEHATTYLMSKSDAASARLTWLAAFYEAGGDLKNKSTWTEDRFIKAGSKTTSLQNTSSAIFTGEAFQRPTSANAALWKAAMFSFKSFAANTMVNFWLAAPQAFTRKEAAQIAAAQATSSLAYGLAQPLRAMFYAGTANAVAKVLTGEEPPEPEDEEQYLIKSIIEGTYSLMFGGLPNFIDPYLRLYLSKGPIKSMVDDPDYEVGTAKAYLYSAKNMDAASKTLLGIYGPLGYSAFDMSMYAYESYIDSDGKTQDEINENYEAAVTGAIAETIVLNPYIPLRGDLYKTVNKYKQAQNAKKFDSGTNSARRKRKQIKRKRVRRGN